MRLEVSASERASENGADSVWIADIDSWAAPSGFFRARRDLLWGATAGVGTLAWLLAPAGKVPPFIYFQF